MVQYTLRGQTSSRRRILADSNASVVHAGMHHGAGGGGGGQGGAGKRHMMAAVEESLGSITSENFVRVS